jgi:hypothetical protein
MSLSTPSIDTRPSVVAIATVKNLVADVSRVAGQTQMMVQDSNAFSGAQSANNMTDTAVISQVATGTNEKEIGIRNQVAPISTEILATDFDSLSRATIEQNQGTIQGTFAQGTDFDGNSSSAINNATLSEDVAQDQVSGIRYQVSGAQTTDYRLQTTDSEAAALQHSTLESGIGNQVSGIRYQVSGAQTTDHRPQTTNSETATLQHSNTPALQHSTFETAAATEPELPASAIEHRISSIEHQASNIEPDVDTTPAGDSHTLHRPLSVREEQNRLASSASLSLPSFLGYIFDLARLSIPSFVVQTGFATPDSLLLPSTPVIESNNPLAPLPIFAPVHFTQRPLMFHPNVFTLPAPISLNVMA